MGHFPTCRRRNTKGALTGLAPCHSFIVASCEEEPCQSQGFLLSLFGLKGRPRALVRFLRSYVFCSDISIRHYIHDTTLCDVPVDKEAAAPRRPQGACSLSAPFKLGSLDSDKVAMVRVLPPDETKGGANPDGSP